MWPVSGAVVRGVRPARTPRTGRVTGASTSRRPPGLVVLAPAAGVVTFAGSVGGRLFVTIDQGGGLLSTCSFPSGLLVRKGDVVVQGQHIALSGSGHAGDVVARTCIWAFGSPAQYVDPLDYLAAMSIVDLIHLAPIMARLRAERRFGPRPLEWRGFARPRARFRTSTPPASERGRPADPGGGRTGTPRRRRVGAGDRGLGAVPGRPRSHRVRGRHGATPVSSGVASRRSARRTERDVGLSPTHHRRLIRRRRRPRLDRGGGRRDRRGAGGAWIVTTDPPCRRPSPRTSGRRILIYTEGFGDHPPESSGHPVAGGDAESVLPSVLRLRIQCGPVRLACRRDRPRYPGTGVGRPGAARRGQSHRCHRRR